MSGKIRAAILLPLSGPHATLGQAMLNAAQQAVFDASGNNFVLLPQDTAGAGGADTAARAALNGGTDIFIGPLFATDIPAVKAVAQSAGVPVLALSTDTTHADRDLYVMGLAPGQQVERIVTYAVAHGAHRFAALVPNTPYGMLVGRAFRDEVSRVGGVVSIDEIYGGAAEAADHARTIAAQAETIDALFLPDSGDNLKAIADALAAGGVNPARTHLLGTGLWDGTGLAQQSALLLGAWYAAPDPAARRTFVSGYAAAFGHEPPRLATLAYDATALAALLAKRGARYEEATLTNANGDRKSVV
jgi:ABC-type branched-subunit amino acid transport system substrate-binding protein